MDRRAARREPRNADYDALFELAHTPTLEVDGAGVVLRMNAAAARLVDVSPDAATGTSLDDLLDVEATTALAADEPKTLVARTAHGRTALVVRTMRRTLQAADGHRFTVQLSPEPRSGDPNSTSAPTLHWSAIDDLGNSLGTPLSIVAGYAETLASHTTRMSGDAIADAATAMHRHATRAIDELQALQARVRLRAGSAGTVPTSVLLAWLRRILEPNLAAANAALVGNAEADTVTLDVAVTRQALLNACTVALRAEPRPRVIELTVRSTEEGTHFELTPDLAPTAGDPGPDAAFTIDVTRSLLASRGGSYHPPSADDPRHVLVLPTAAHGQPDPELPTIPVAVIEDDPDTAVLIRTSLRNSSRLFRVVADERTFRAGLAAIAQHQPRIVLLDQQLPDRIGTEGLDELRAAAPGARIVVLSVRSPTDPEELADGTVWLEKGRVLADLGTELIGVLADGQGPASPGSG